jgi:hypothetical protein
VKPNYDWQLYAARHPIENFFAGIKRLPAIVTATKKSRETFLLASNSSQASCGLIDDRP